MKKIIIGVAGCLMLVAGVACADIETVVNTEVTYAVETVKVPSVTVMRMRDSKLVLTAPYTWLDASNRVLRTGTHRITQENLSAALGEYGPAVLCVLNGIVPAGGIQPMAVFNFMGNGEVSVMSRSIVGSGTNRTVTVVRYATNEVGEAIAPLTVPQLRGMIQQLTHSVAE